MFWNLLNRLYEITIDMQLRNTGLIHLQIAEATKLLKSDGTSLGISHNQILVIINNVYFVHKFLSSSYYDFCLLFQTLNLCLPTFSVT